MRVRTVTARWVLEAKGPELPMDPKPLPELFGWRLLKLGVGGQGLVGGGAKGEGWFDQVLPPPPPLRGTFVPIAVGKPGGPPKAPRVLWFPPGGAMLPRRGS